MFTFVVEFTLSFTRQLKSHVPYAVRLAAKRLSVIPVLPMPECVGCQSVCEFRLLICMV